MKPETMRSSVDFPAAGGTEESHQLAGADIQVYGPDGGEIAEGLRDLLKMQFMTIASDH